MKSYIDVNFRIEEDLSHWSEEEKEKIVACADEFKKFFKEDITNILKEHTTGDIKNFTVNISFDNKEGDDI